MACEGCIYAVGGWYLDSLVTPDSSTALYTAVECYDPWEDTWRFVCFFSLVRFWELRLTLLIVYSIPKVYSGVFGV